MSSVTFFVLVVVIISIMWNSSFLAFYFLWHHQENDNYLLVINSYLFLREFLILLVEKLLKLRSIKLITFFYILLDIQTLYYLPYRPNPLLPSILFSLCKQSKSLLTPSIYDRFLSCSIHCSNLFLHMLCSDCHTCQQYLQTGAINSTTLLRWFQNLSLLM